VGGAKTAMAQQITAFEAASSNLLSNKDQFRILAQENAFDPVERKFIEHLPMQQILNTLMVSQG
jgi:hypothetical protein